MTTKLTTLLQYLRIKDSCMCKAMSILPKYYVNVANAINKVCPYWITSKLYYVFYRSFFYIDLLLLSVPSIRTQLLLIFPADTSGLIQLTTEVPIIELLIIFHFISFV